jgi:uncharacterized protein
MIIEVARVSLEGSTYTGEEPASILELNDNPQVRPEGPVRYDLSAQVAGHELIVQGTLAVPLSLECSRCAGFFSTTLRVSSFLRAYEVPDGTETVDLTADIREDILVDLPTVSLCSPTCKGLCPKCGKNWNDGPCSCKPASGEAGTWTALDGLKVD